MKKEQTGSYVADSVSEGESVIELSGGGMSVYLVAGDSDEARVSVHGRRGGLKAAFKVNRDSLGDLAGALRKHGLSGERA